MKNFLAIFTGSAEAMAAWKALPEAERTEREARGKRAWHDWAERHQGSIVQLGAPVGKTKRVSSDGVADIRNQIGAYTVVCAESHEAAARLFLGHPHFAIFPGDGVEVMECLPIPGR